MSSWRDGDRIPKDGNALKVCERHWAEDLCWVIVPKVGRCVTPTLPRWLWRLGRNPCKPNKTKYLRAASSVVEHLTFNQGVPGSIPGRPTKILTNQTISRMAGGNK